MFKSVLLLCTTLAGNVVVIAVDTVAAVGNGDFTAVSDNLVSGGLVSDVELTRILSSLS